MTREVAAYVAIGASIGVCVGLAARHLIDEREPSLALPPQVAMAGARLLPVLLVDFHGRGVPIDLPSKGPLGIMVFRPRDCLSCVRLPADAWDFHRWLAMRGGRLMLVAVVDSADESELHHFARTYRLPVPIAIDSIGYVKRTLGESRAPSAALIGADGIVLATWSRAQGAPSAIPLAQILRDLSSVVLVAAVAAGDCTPLSNCSLHPWQGLEPMPRANPG